MLRLSDEKKHFFNWSAVIVHATRMDEAHEWCCAKFGKHTTAFNFTPQYRAGAFEFEDRERVVINTDAKWEYAHAGACHYAFCFKNDVDAVEFKLIFG